MVTIMLAVLFSATTVSADPPLPDLKVLNVEVPSESVKVGEYAQCSWTVGNTGLYARADCDTRFDVYVYYNGIIAPDGVQHYEGLKKGQTETHDFKLIVLRSGSHRVSVYVDYWIPDGGNVDEGNEHNNIKTVYFDSHGKARILQGFFNGNLLSLLSKLLPMRFLQ